MEQVAPTKTNLFKIKRMLKTAKEGFSLLDRKRNVLIHELLSVVGQVKELETGFNSAFERAQSAIQDANILAGSSTVTTLCDNYVADAQYTIVSKSVMGVSIPMIKQDKKTRAEIKFNPHGSNLPIDSAAAEFRSLLDVAIRKSTLETAIIRLAQEIKTTQKRANALNNILIPRYTEQIKFIVEFLEEKEREEFFKVKLIKKKKM
ncbi:MAG: hypothetical protein A2583_02590 [Bdellovibrionales bacterium RIFOXYD1_FULL_53_11]|nr:MAG: hypothetical protein A2583_02590 [Bdellovibrionales bacterium RIFOXYD1_FULL_53_11]